MKEKEIGTRKIPLWEDHVMYIYGKCRPFGSCNSWDSPICTCLKGFEPRDKGEWDNGNWTGAAQGRNHCSVGEIPLLVKMDL